MDDVVSKPFRIPDLIPKIEELVIKGPTMTVIPPPLTSVAELAEADAKIGKLAIDQHALEENEKERSKIDVMETN